jgi:hypothetical protein
MARLEGDERKKSQLNRPCSPSGHKANAWISVSTRSRKKCVPKDSSGLSLPSARPNVSVSSPEFRKTYDESRSVVKSQFGTIRSDTKLYDLIWTDFIPRVKRFSQIFTRGGALLPAVITKIRNFCTKITTLFLSEIKKLSLQELTEIQTSRLGGSVLSG